MKLETETGLQGTGLIPVELSETDQSRFARIVKLHLAAAIFFLVQTVAYASVPVNLKVDPSVGFPVCTGGPICDAGIKLIGNFNPIFVIPLFTGLAALDHFLSWAWGHLYPDSAKYWWFVAGSNPLRWAEYSISASLMAVAICILSGIHDVHLWFLVFCMHAVGMLLGLVIELLPKSDNLVVSQDGTYQLPASFATLRKLCYGISATSIFTPWLVIMCYFFYNVEHSDDKVPDFVYAAFLGTFLLFCTFGVNSFLHNILSYYDFPTAEVVYIVLSFTSKTFLAADVFGGLKAGDNDDN
jgi:hypothetical protein